MATEYFPDSATELWKLIERRSTAEADTDEVDRLIWDRFGDEGAIMYTDLAGFTRCSEELGVTHFLQTIYQSQKILRPVVDQHSGVVIEVVGDSMLVWFKAIENALRAAVAMQASCRQFNVDRQPHDQVLTCIGIGYGRVLRIGYSHLVGRELNVASKLGEDLAEPYDILVSQDAKTAANHLPEFEYQATGGSLPGSLEIFRVAY